MNKHILYTAVLAALSVTSVFAEDKSHASFILDSIYVHRSNTEEKVIQGFPSGGHNHGLEDGFSVGHSELNLGAEFSDVISGVSTVAIVKEDGSYKAEVEELYLKGSGLLPGMNLKAGRFLSDIGYLSSKHTHEWDFTQSPLVYSSLFGDHVNGDGLQINYLAPTERFLQFGVELLDDGDFPGGDSSKTLGAWTAYAKTGGDVGTDHSWLAGIGYYQADDIQRDGGGHDHDHGHGEETGGEEEHAESPRFSGDTATTGVNLVYKWAPGGNPKQKNLKLQGEYFWRDEDGKIDMVGEDGDVEESSSYDGDQQGWYVSGVYQFMPRWRAGLRYEGLNSNNSGADEEILDEAGLHDEGHTPKRISAMVDFSRDHYSRLRLQYSKDESTPEHDHQVMLQYTHSFGSHGAHRF